VTTDKYLKVDNEHLGVTMYVRLRHHVHSDNKLLLATHASDRAQHLRFSLPAAAAAADDDDKDLK